VTQLLAQQGLWVTAKRAALTWAPSFFLSLVERAASDQEEGRLGMELLRIRSVFERAGPDALVVMDELCSGTNPSEGEEIFEMVLELFGEVRPQVLISTHFLDFAARLEQRGASRLKFVQVDLGPHDIPTYRFVPGVAKTSMARATAARLGVTREELFELATRRAYRAPE
jgi:DNA mismatch repair protein MutS2